MGIARSTKGQWGHLGDVEGHQIALRWTSGMLNNVKKMSRHIVQC
jgi:hypothetical protein